MKIFRKVLIIGTVILVIGLGSFLIISSRKQPTLVSQETVPQPNIPVFVKGQLNIENKITKDQFSFPSSLPLLEVNKGLPFTDNDAVNLATNLGFTNKPIVSKDVFEGTTYIWNNPNNQSLIIYPGVRRLEYTLKTSYSATNKQLSDSEIISIAKNFLTTKNIVDQNNIAFSFFSYYKSTNNESFNLTTKDQANLIQVNFSPLSLNTKLITINPAASPIFVWILPDGSIAKVSVTKFGEITKGLIDYKILSYDEYLKSLSKAVIISLNDGNISLQDTNRQNINKVTIEKIELAYLVDSPNSNFFQPIFLLSGKADLKNYSASKVNITLYLQATSQL